MKATFMEDLIVMISLCSATTIQSTEGNNNTVSGGLGNDFITLISGSDNTICGGEIAWELGEIACENGGNSMFEVFGGTNHEPITVWSEQIRYKMRP